MLEKCVVKLYYACRNMEQDHHHHHPRKKNLALSQVYAGFCGASITITNGPSFEPETTEKGLKKAHKETLSFFIKKASYKMLER